MINVMGARFCAHYLLINIPLHIFVAIIFCYTMKRLNLLIATILIGLCAKAQNSATSSSSMTTSPWAVSVPYNIADEGTKYEFKFGMGGWSWDFFALQQRNHCGRENLDIARVGFNGRFDKAYDALTAEQKATMDTELRNIVQTGVKSIFLLCGIGNLGDQLGDLTSAPVWDETTRTNYVDDIVRAVEYVEGKGYKVFAVAPFNEPDFEKTYTGTATNFNAVAAIMQTRPNWQVGYSAPARSTALRLPSGTTP